MFYFWPGAVDDSNFSVVWEVEYTVGLAFCFLLFLFSGLVNFVFSSQVLETLSLSLLHCLMIFMSS